MKNVMSMPAVIFKYLSLVVAAFAVAVSSSMNQFRF